MLKNTLQCAILYIIIAVVLSDELTEDAFDDTPKCVPPLESIPTLLQCFKKVTGKDFNHSSTKISSITVEVKIEVMICAGKVYGVISEDEKTFKLLKAKAIVDYMDADDDIKPNWKLDLDECAAKSKDGREFVTCSHYAFMKFSKLTNHGNHVNYTRILRHLSSFKFKDIQIESCGNDQRSTKPESSKLQFGKHFTDHMLEVDWTTQDGWGIPRISPLHHFKIHPAAKALHYATQLFEGMKAFKGVDNKLRLFRPDMNMKRMIATSIRAGLPAFDGNEMIECIKKLVLLDQDWVPKSEMSSLYIRPTFIGTDPTLGVNASNAAKLFVIQGPVGPYFTTGVKPVSLLADPKFVRAWPGGCGDKKMGSNYAPTVAIQKHAESNNFQQVLWLYGNDHQITEVGTMNIFVFLINKNGEKELITPPLNGLILPGVTRQSLLDIARQLNNFKVTERSITMTEILIALEEKRLLEVFGSGTACVVCPVELINYLGKNYNIPTMEHNNPLNMQFLKKLTDIQYGRIKHPWAVEIEEN